MPVSSWWLLAEVCSTLTQPPMNLCSTDREKLGDEGASARALPNALQMSADGLESRFMRLGHAWLPQAHHECGNLSNLCDNKGWGHVYYIARSNSGIQDFVIFGVLRNHLLRHVPEERMQLCKRALLAWIVLLVEGEQRVHSCAKHSPQAPHNASTNIC